MKFLIHSLGYILGYAKDLYTVRPEQPYYIHYLPAGGRTLMQTPYKTPSKQTIYYKIII